MMQHGTASARPLTALLAQSVRAAAAYSMDADQQAMVRNILVDWLGCALAGLHEPVSQILCSEFARSAGEAMLIGGGRASLADAALVNGTIGHALDYDDVQQFIGHPATVIVPAALAIAEATGASGAQLQRAIIAGYDAAHFVGTLVMPAHYDHGFHSTGTVGTFGAAAAAAVLLQLSEAQTVMALALAATQAAGLKSMFGTMAKPFHAGRAASAGVAAARLAARGMTANPLALETGQGFLATQAQQPVPGGWQPPAFGDGLGPLFFKYHASCYLTHSTIEAVRKLMLLHGIQAEDVARLSIHVPAGHLRVCNIADPRTGLESKFSLRQVAALVLSGHDTSDIAVFNDQLAQAPAQTALRASMQVAGDQPAGFASRVGLTVKSGETFAQAHDSAQSDLDSKALAARLDNKFLRLANHAIGSSAAQKILDFSYTLASSAAPANWLAENGFRQAKAA